MVRRGQVRGKHSHRDGSVERPSDTKTLISRTPQTHHRCRAISEKWAHIFSHFDVPLPGCGRARQVPNVAVGFGRLLIVAGPVTAPFLLQAVSASNQGVSEGPLSRFCSCAASPPPTWQVHVPCLSEAPDTTLRGADEKRELNDRRKPPRKTV
jgi:hypothetical protein